MAKPTGELLTKLRSVMKNKAYVPDALQAYVIPTEDAHQVKMDPKIFYLFFIYRGIFSHNCTSESLNIYLTTVRNNQSYMYVKL